MDYFVVQEVAHKLDMSYGMLGSLFRSGEWEHFTTFFLGLTPLLFNLHKCALTKGHMTILVTYRA